MLFSDGVSTITDISAQTKVGILFSVVLACLTKEGREMLLNDSKLTERQYLNMIQTFETLLCYWQWLKKEEFWDVNDLQISDIAKSSIFKLIDGLKHLFPRTSGNQWKMSKIHEQLHVAHNIYSFGAHQNIHTGPVEHNHIEMSKKPSQHTQKKTKF